jgi:hypothetical protein
MIITRVLHTPAFRDRSELIGLQAGDNFARFRVGPLDLDLPVKECPAAEKPKATGPIKLAKAPRAARRGSDWNKSFDLKKAPKIWQAAQAPDHRRGEAM